MTNRFLDIEARVEEADERDDDEEFDIDDDFLDDTEHEEHGNDHRTALAMRRQCVRDMYDNSFVSLLESLHARADENRERTFDIVYSGKTEDIIRHPGADDYGIWRVTCRVGFEEYILASLLNSAQPEHELRSASTRQSLRGAVYLECQMNEQLIQLLKTIPGILQSRNGIQYKAISYTDGIRLLTMKDDQREISVGKWVMITRGLYKGDVALILDVDEWGVDALVLPRFSYSSFKKNQKRKATGIRPQPDLFNSSKLDQSIADKLSSSTDDTQQRFGPYRFEYGLLLQQFNFACIGRPATTMPWHERSLFLLSTHPCISRSPPPWPIEWTFAENEKISIVATKKIGFIICLDGENADIDIPSEGTQRVSMNDIQKYFITGSYVRITAGPHREKEGWVTRTEGQTAWVYIDSPENKIDNDTYKATAQIIDIHINSAKLTDPPFHLAQESRVVPHLRERHIRHPWCGTQVTISKIGDPRKGQSGEIIDVLSNENSPGGLSLLIQLQQFNPVSPFPVIRTELDSVVQTRTRKHIMDYFKINPITASQPLHSQPAVIDNGANRTPMATASTTTPAWDPSSRTPLDFLLSRSPSWSQETENSSQRTEARISQQPAPEHQLIHSSFLGKNFQVTVNGGPYDNKELTAKVLMVDGKMLLRYPCRGTDYALQPEWVHPLHPSPTHDNGLVIVIQGEHHGKYLRRLHHEGYKHSALMIAAVVERRKDAVDYFTGEVITIDCKSLCVVKETPEEIKRMKTIMLEKRTAYRNSRKK